MKGILKKELLAFLRRNPWGYFSSMIFPLLLVLFMGNIYSLLCITVFYLPLVCNISMTLKEIDVSCSSFRYSLTLPYSWKDLIRSRFLLSFADVGVESLFSLALVLLHYLRYQTVALSAYLLLWSCGMLLGLAMGSIHTMISFLAGVTVSAVFFLAICVLAIGGFLLVFSEKVSLNFLSVMPGWVFPAGLIAAAAAAVGGSYGVTCAVMERSRRRK